MNKLLILCCINIFSVIYAAPLKSDAKIIEFLQSDFLRKCPSVLNNNILIHKSSGGLSHCTNVSISDPSDDIGLSNLNEYYCIGILAADIQLCSSNRTDKLPKSYTDLKENIGRIKKEKPEKICAELKQLKLFNETENIAPLKKWIEILDKNLHGLPCVRLCSDIVTDNTNTLCSMLYYINNNITYVANPERKTEPSKVTSEIPTTPVLSKVNIQPKVNPIQSSPMNNSVAVAQPPSQISSADVKNNSPQNEIVTVNPSAIVITNTVAPSPEKKQPDLPVGDIAKEEKHQTTVAPTVVPKQNDPIKKQEQVVIPVDNAPVQAVPAKPKESPPENPIPEIPEEPANQKVEPSTVSSTISGLRDNADISEDYFDEMDEANKDEGLLNPQTNTRKEKIEILPNEQDRHRIPSDDDATEEMEDSNFFSYFMFISVMFIAGYVVYHNKQKIMALLVEGRRDRNSRRRPNTASYRKLNSNLEEAVTSKCSGSASHVIY